MDDKHFEDVDGLELSMPHDQSYRTCSTCGGDCEPETSAIDGLGVRIMFVCPEHGAQSVVDPFSDLR